MLPRSREQERFTLLVVVTVTALSTMAMLLYRLLAHALALSPAQAGLFLGGSPAEADRRRAQPTNDARLMAT